MTYQDFGKSQIPKVIEIGDRVISVTVMLRDTEYVLHKSAKNI